MCQTKTSFLKNSLTKHSILIENFHCLLERIKKVNHGEIKMGSKIWAFVAYNMYSLILISAFQKNTSNVYSLFQTIAWRESKANLFNVSLINQIKLNGFLLNPLEWGWYDHYIWRLFSGVVVTAIVGILAGAFAKKDGARTAAIANIPSIIIWAGMIYLFTFVNSRAEGRTGFIIVSIIAIPLTTFLAYKMGGLGETIQEKFPEGTVLGMKRYHWIWAVIPLYLYSFGIVFATTKFIGFELAMWIDDGENIFTVILLFLMLLPVIAWVYPFRLVHRILIGELLNAYATTIKVLTNLVILVAGVIFAIGIQFGIYWLLSKIIF